jgi:hypothetical protein
MNGPRLRWEGVYSLSHFANLLSKRLRVARVSMLATPPIWRQRETVSRANAMMRSAAGSGSMATLRKGGHLRTAAPRLSAAPRVSAAWSPLPRRSLAQLAATITTITTTMPRVKSNESNAFT